MSHPTPAQHRVIAALKASPLAWVGSQGNAYREICPAGTSALYGEKITRQVWDGMQALGMLVRRELSDEQQAEYVRRAGSHMTPPDRGWFLAQARTAPKGATGNHMTPPDRGWFLAPSKK